MSILNYHTGILVHDEDTIVQMYGVEKRIQSQMQSTIPKRLFPITKGHKQTYQLKVLEEKFGFFTVQNSRINVRSRSLDRTVVNKVFFDTDVLVVIDNINIHSCIDAILPTLNPIELKIDNIHAVDAAKFHDLAMKELYSYVYDLLSESNFEECNLALEYFNAKDFSLELLVAFARVTKPHKVELVNRKKLVKKLSDVLYDECSEEEARSIISHVV